LLLCEARGDKIEKRRGYPGDSSKIDGAHTFIIRNFKVTDLDPLPRTDAARLADCSPLSVFNAIPARYGGRDSGVTEWYLQYYINIESVVNDRACYCAGNGKDYRFVLQLYDWLDEQRTTIVVPFVPGAPNYKIGDFVDIRVDLDADGAIRLWQNNDSKQEQWQLVSKGFVPDEAKKHIKIESWHAGLYGNFKTATVTNGVIEIYKR